MLDFCPFASSNTSAFFENSTGNVSSMCALAETDGSVSNQNSIPTESYVNYTSIVFCNSNLSPLGLMFSIGWLAVLFTTLATTADEYFCSSLEIIAKALKFSQNVAGVTLLAFGNGAPEIFASLAGTTRERSELVISYLIGSGIFLTCIVAGIIVIVSPFKMVELPFLRDVIFYLIASFWTFWVLCKGVVTLYYSLVFILIYAIYLMVVLVAHHFHRQWTLNHPPIPFYNPTVEEINDDSYESSGNSSKRNIVLTGDEITPWGGPHYIKKSWSMSHEEYQNSPRLSINPMIDPNDVSESLSDLRCEYCLVQAKSYVSPVKAAWICYQLTIAAFFKELSPINIENWDKKPLWRKLSQIVKVPINIILKLTIPVVTRWCQPLNALHCIISPMFFLFAIGYGSFWIYGLIPVWGLVLGIGAVFTITIFVTSTLDKPPTYHMVFAIISFVSSITWVYILANEIVGLLTTLGLVFKISDSILGLTILAWGNSINDVVSDVSIAREGYPQMGMSACFGGPLFNLLLGLGISFTTASLHTSSHQIKIHFEQTTKILISFLFASLISSLLIVPFIKFDLKRWYGLYLFTLYGVFLIVIILNECGVF